MDSNFRKGFEKIAFTQIDPTTAGIFGSIPVGWSTGKSTAQSVSNIVSKKGYKTKNEDLSRNIANITALLGTLAGLGLSLKHKDKLISLGKKYITKDPQILPAMSGAVPFIGGVGGGIASGAATGGLIGLRGRFKKEDNNKADKSKED